MHRKTCTVANERALRLVAEIGTRIRQHTNCKIHTAMTRQDESSNNDARLLDRVPDPSLATTITSMKVCANITPKLAGASLGFTTSKILTKTPAHPGENDIMVSTFLFPHICLYEPYTCLDSHFKKLDWNVRDSLAFGRGSAAGSLRPMSLE